MAIARPIFRAGGSSKAAGRGAGEERKAEKGGKGVLKKWLQQGFGEVQGEPEEGRWRMRKERRKVRKIWKAEGLPIH